MVDVPVSCRLFGAHVLTCIPPHCAHGASGRVDLEVVPGDEAGPDTSPLGPPVLSMPMVHPEGDGQYEAWVRGDSLVLRIPPVAKFSCTPGRIEYRTLNPVAEEALQWQLFGLVMSTWSEWVGRPVLHAATVQVDGAAVGFLGESGAGKSSITLEFLNNGHRIFGDDHLILDRSGGAICALPALPWLKVGPALAARLGMDRERLPRIHSSDEKRHLDLEPGQWADGAAPLAACYLIERGWDRPEVVIEPLSPAASLMALVQQTFAPRTVAATGLIARRLPLLAAAVEQAGVWRIRYPNGAEWLEKLRAAVVRHVRERVSESLVRSPR